MRNKARLGACIAFLLVAGLWAAFSLGQSAQGSLPTTSVTLPTLPLPTTASKPSSKPSSVEAVPDLARNIAIAVNTARRAHGLRTLRIVVTLRTAAVAHAQALAVAGQFTHSWPDGRSFRKWIRSYYSRRGYRTWNVAENLFWSTHGSEDASAVIAGWLASPTHRRILLSRGWRQLGLGVIAANDAPGYYDDSDVDIVAAEFGIRKR